MKNSKKSFMAGLMSIATMVISLMIGASAFAAAGNDTMGSAASISLNSSVTKKLVSNSDEDWYKVTIADTGCFSITLGPSAGSSTSDIEDGWNYEIMDKNRNVLLEDTYVETTTTSYKRALVPDTYYIRVYSPYFVSGANYTLKTVFVKNEKWITDQYGKDTTKSIAFDNMYYGNMLNNEDVDMFAFKVTENGHFALFIGPTADSKESDIKDGWNIKILDTAGNTLIEKNYANRSVKSRELAMEPGIYIAKISSPYFQSYADYHLKVVFTEDPAWIADRFGHDSYKDIEFGKKYFGNMLNGDDIDNFRITVPAKGYMTFTLAPDPSGNSSGINSGWNYCVLDPKGNTLDRKNYVDTAVTTKRVPVNKGSYLFRVSAPYSYSKLIYNVTANYTPAPAKRANTLKVSGKTMTVKQSKLKKKAIAIKRTKAIVVNGAAGNVSYKLVSATKGKQNFNRRFRVDSKTGRVVIKKNLKKGKYILTVNVTAAGNGNYERATKKAFVMIRVR